MNAATLHPDRAPPRDTALPYLYSAPLALVVAGGLLVAWGPLALATPWAAPTLALTHVATLGFLSMVAVGMFVPLAAVAGNVTVPRPMTAHVVYYALVIGVAGLAYGTAAIHSGPVFLAIGAVGVMAVVFIWHGVTCLRRAEDRGSTVRALRAALWSFFLAASLGVWLAHGHGGMLFPGPRGLWLGVHLSVALIGWIGGMTVAFTAEALPARSGVPALDERLCRLMDRGVVVGVTLPVTLLLAQYAGLVPADTPGLLGWASVTLLPAAIAVWILHPIVAWRALAGAEQRVGLGFVRVGLGVAPVVFVLGAAAVFVPDPRVGMLFGWLAIAGWASSLLAAGLVVVLPGLLAPPALPESLPPLAGLLRAALWLHVAAVVSGAVAIVLPGAGAAARIAGALVCASGLALGAAVVRSRRSKRTVAG